MSTLLARVFACLPKGRGPSGRQRICKAAAGNACAKCIQPLAAIPPQSISAVTPTSTTATLSLTSTLALSLLLTSLAATTHADNAAIYTRRIGINVTPTTELEVSGTISATSLRINGVPISGGGASPGDFIASGTTKVTANSTGYVSFTTGGTTTGYMDTSGRFIIPGVSTTAGISATQGYFPNNVGIGSAPNSTYPLYVTGQSYFNGYVYLGSSANIQFVSNDTGLYWPSNGAGVVGNGSSKYLAFITSNTEAMRIVGTGLVGIGTAQPSSTLHLYGTDTSITLTSAAGRVLKFENTDTNASARIGTMTAHSLGFLTNANIRMLIDANGNIGIGTGSAVPSATLHVSGTVSATRFVGDGSGLTGIVGASSGDNIASGTTKVTANTTGYVSFTTGGTTTGYMDAAGNFILPGVSSTGRISATSLNPEIIPLRELSDASGSTTLGSLYIGSGVGTTGNPSATDNVGVGNAMFSSTSMSGAANTGLGRYVMNNLSSGTGNTAVGRGSMWQTTTGNYNASVGFASMFSNATGGYNTSLGSSALTNMTDGWYNVAAGSSAGNGADTVSQSVFIGHQAGYGVSGTTTGLLNEVMIGFKAGYSITTGGYNTFLGTNAGYNVTSGGGNIMIGAQTYAPTATSSNALNIGNLIYASGLVASVSTGSGIGKVGINFVTPSVALEVSGTVSATRFAGDGSGLTGISAGSLSTGASGSLVYRDQSGNLVASSSLSISSTTGSVGIGAGAPANIGSNGLYADGTIYSNSNFRTSSAGGYYIGNATVGMSGNNSSPNQNLAFTVSSTEAMRIVSTGYVGIGTTQPSATLHVSGSSIFSGNVNIQNNGTLSMNNSAGIVFGSGGNNTGSIYGYAGRGVGINTIPPGSVANGLYVSGSVIHTSWTGLNITTTPTAPLEVSGTVSASRFVGDGSGLTGIVGASSGDNIASGTTKVTANTTGYVSFTTGGTTTGYMDTAGNFILPGVSLTSAGISSTNGYFSGIVGIGTNPTGGYSLATSQPILTTNLYLGASGAQSVNWGNSNLSITGNATSTNKYLALTTSGTEAMRIVSTGYVGIGTSTPNSSLHVAGGNLTLDTGKQIQFGTSTYGFIKSASGGSGWLKIGTGGSDALFIDNVQRVGIGTNSPTANLEVSGTISATSLRSSGDIEYSGTLRDTSDRRLKTNIGPLPYDDVLGRVMLLKPVQYERRAVPGRIEWGFIAQDVERQFPQLVTAANDPSGTLSISYLGLLAPMTQAIQQLKADNDNLRTQVGSLKADNNNLKASNENLTKRLDAQQRDIDALKKSAGMR